MKIFDVQIVSKDIINAEPLATCVVTSGDMYFATVRYNYFTNDCKAINIIEAANIQRLFGIKTLDKYDALIAHMDDCVLDAIAKKITH